ncbi:MAG: DUF1893 domain-containing protein [Chloroflexota bacterium]
MDYKDLFDEFLVSHDTLRIYKDDKLLFLSNKDRVLPLLEYIDRFADSYRQVVIFDKVMGNAAALLAVKAGCTEVYSPLGSQLAIKTLDKHSIKYHLTNIVPYIQRDDGQGMCPMEQLSIDKEPEEFFVLVKNMVK